MSHEIGNVLQQMMFTIEGYELGAIESSELIKMKNKIKVIAELISIYSHIPLTGSHKLEAFYEIINSLKVIYQKRIIILGVISKDDMDFLTPAAVYASWIAKSNDLRIDFDKLQIEVINGDVEKYHLDEDTDFGCIIRSILKGKYKINMQNDAIKFEKAEAS
jgi:hypothetical protein